MYECFIMYSKRLIASIIGLKNSNLLICLHLSNSKMSHVNPYNKECQESTGKSTKKKD